MPLEVVEWSNDRVRAIVPVGETPEPAIPAGIGELVVFDPGGVPSPPARVEVVHTSAPAAGDSDGRLSADVLARLDDGGAATPGGEDAFRATSAGAPG